MMKKLSLLTITLALSFAVIGAVSADDAGDAADASVQSSMETAPVSDGATDTTVSSGDPTLDFFLSIQQCKQGVYQQKNALSDSVGPEFLQQTIIGMGDTGCKVILTTPDSRVMYCSLTGADLQAMRDQHFLKGMMSDTTDSPSQESVNADITWTQIKAASCSYTPYEN